MGWLIDQSEPQKRVRFDLLIDGRDRGTYFANRRRRSLLKYGDGAHGFAIPIERSWVTGEVQRVTLDYCGDPRRGLSLEAPLGPAARQLYSGDDAVAEAYLDGTHAETVADANGIHANGAAYEGDAAAGVPLHPAWSPDAAADSNALVEELIRRLARLSDREVARLLTGIEREIVLTRLRKHYAEGDDRAASVFIKHVLSRDTERLRVSLGRAAMQGKDIDSALRLLAGAATVYPQSFDAAFYAGVAHARADRFDESLEYLRRAEQQGTDPLRAKREILSVLRRAKRESATERERDAVQEQSIAVLREICALTEGADRAKNQVMLARTLYDARQYAEAVTVADEALAVLPDDVDALIAKARSFVAQNAVAEARQIYEQVLLLHPDHRNARMNLRILRVLDDKEMHDRPLTLEIVNTAETPVTAENDPVQLLQFLSERRSDWVLLRDRRPGEHVPQQLVDILNLKTARAAGYVSVSSEDGPAYECWRSDALLSLAESGLITDLRDGDALRRWAPFYAPPSAAISRRAHAAAGGGRAVVMSRHGNYMFGGGEHFIRSAAEHYAHHGYEPIIVGTRPEFRGETGVTEGGFPYAFIAENAADMRRYFLENDVALVHTISGLGFPAAEALGLTNIPFVYGVHYWRELLGEPGSDVYFDERGRPRPHREFRFILSRAKMVYANSQYTQEVVETCFGVRCPVIFSIPPELAVAP
jgi:tetratricopeptide (TPR) repeat protein